jgi:LacI family transcriptional regulator
MNKRITIKEIARLADVSIGTVDRVLHDRGRVAKATGERILKIAQDGNYSSNLFARNLKLGKTFKIAVLVPSDNYFGQMLLQGIAQGIEDYSSFGFYQKDFLTIGARSPLTPPGWSIETALANSPDALILSSKFLMKEKRAVEMLEQSGVPCITLGSNLQSIERLFSIGHDSYQSGLLGARLLDPGYGRRAEVFIVTLDEEDLLNRMVNERVTGFKKYFDQNKSSSVNIHDINLEFDDLPIADLKQELLNLKHPIHAFIPSHKPHLLLNELREIKKELHLRSVVYDLLPENVALLRNNTLDFIIHHKPKMQGYLAVQTLYRKFVLGDDIPPSQYISSDVITNENLTFVQQ